jgi:alpha-D-xyloside xylohydrolase
VYLPEGADWYDVVTGERFAGGVMVTVEAPLDHLPLYARAGTVIPTTPGVTRASARVEWLDVRVFAGADGVFVLYEDEGDGHAYQEGTFATVPLSWSEADGTLTVGPRSGTFPGVPAEVAVTATLTEGPGPAAGTGLPWAGGTAASGVFDGTLLVLALRG